VIIITDTVAALLTPGNKHLGFFVGNMAGILE